MNTKHKTYLQAGQRYCVCLPYSEVCMHMQVAGKIAEIELSEYLGAAQIHMNGKPFSSPILACEAGVFEDEDGKYAYVQTQGD